MTIALRTPDRASVAPAVVAVGAGAAALALTLPLSPAGAVLAAGLYVAGATLAALAALRLPAPFGLANTLTLVRLAGAALLAGFMADPAPLAGPGGWAAMAAAAALLALDGVDGWVARRQRLASAFGARFDMETDALTILVLAALALMLGKVGPWVLALGALRYAFVLAGLVEPRLCAPLPPSFRRQAVCVLQIAVLAAVLAPPLAPPAAGALTATAFAALAWSFALDIGYLLRPAR